MHRSLGGAARLPQPTRTYFYFPPSPCPLPRSSHYKNRWKRVTMEEKKRVGGIILWRSPSPPIFLRTQFNVPRSRRLGSDWNERRRTPGLASSGDGVRGSCTTFDTGGALRFHNSCIHPRTQRDVYKALTKASEIPLVYSCMHACPPSFHLGGTISSWAVLAEEFHYLLLPHFLSAGIFQDARLYCVSAHQWFQR